MMNHIFQDQTVENKHWTPGIFKMPLAIRVRGIMRWWDLPPDIGYENERFPSNPHWKTPTLTIQQEMCETVSKELCTENIRTIALRTIDERYQGHLQIYTDGSKMDSSTSAAIWIPEVEHQNNWKLQNGDILSIMTAELFGIKKALEWVALNEVLMPKKDIVILTDSLSSLQTIEKPSSSSHSIRIWMSHHPAMGCCAYRPYRQRMR